MGVTHNMIPKTKNIDVEAAVVDFAAHRNNLVDKKIGKLISLFFDIADGVDRPLSREELIERFKDESRGVLKKSCVLRADVRTGMIVGMTKEQSSRFDAATEADVIPLSKGN